MADMENVPLVSVVMAAYNEERRIATAIQSILDQTYTNWELIIVDDGSSDRTLEIVQSSRDCGERVVLIANETNLGLAASLNRGISFARGRYIARMDADDYSYPDRLRLQKDFLDSNSEIAVVGGNADLVDDKGVIIRPTNMPESSEEIAGAIVKKNPLIHPAVMYRKEFVQEMGGYDERLRRKQDYDLWLRGSIRYRYANISNVIIKYNVQYSKSLSADLYGLYVRLLNVHRRRDYFTGFYWAIVVFVVNLMRKIGYRQKMHRKQS